MGGYGHCHWIISRYSASTHQRETALILVVKDATETGNNEDEDLLDLWLIKFPLGSGRSGKVTKVEVEVEGQNYD